MHWADGLKVAVLMGGVSEEREISLSSGDAVVNALKEQGLKVIPVDLKDESGKQLEQIIKEEEINCAFIALHGRYGEDGTVQKQLELLGIPYTGSDVEASRQALNKVAAKELFIRNNISTPLYFVFTPVEEGLEEQIRLCVDEELGTYTGLKLPVVLKPVSGGSTIGVSVVRQEEEFSEAVMKGLSFDRILLIEQYIEGRELTVGILEEKTLPVIEIVPEKGFFDFNAKYYSDKTHYGIPADIPKEVSQQVQQAALKAHRALKCSGMSRVDLILGKDFVPHVLEINTIPGLTSSSLLPKAAHSCGISFPELCMRLIQFALGSECGVH